MTVPVFRFAPSPNGHLHLGHAYSAILNHRAAKRTGGRFLLRIEDIDTVRCTPELEADMLQDLAWLGLEWEVPVLRQSGQFADYAAALALLEQRGLTYRGYLTRGEIKRFVVSYESDGKTWPRDPDGAPHYPGDLAVLGEKEFETRRKGDAPHAVRLDMEKALAATGGPLSWCECAAELTVGDISGDWFHGAAVAADPGSWGDVILARKDTPTSYHLSVVIDDARQGVTDVLRGEDLYQATAVHRLLQELLDLPEPRYRHHGLILDEAGQKLSKSGKSTGLRDLRLNGCSVDEVYGLVGLSPAEE